ncbi:MAG TPA: hypothetical protein VMC09_17405 [Anaerolineales bacterium]|nr:hypothetical protein [Anaerolineales bacterium]
MKTCLNCQKTEQEVPLVTLQYRGQPAYICSECFPTLIHSPAKLAGKIQDAEKIQPARHDH